MSDDEKPTLPRPPDDEARLAQLRAKARTRMSQDETAPVYGGPPVRSSPKPVYGGPAVPVYGGPPAPARDWTLRSIVAMIIAVVVGWFVLRPAGGSGRGAVAVPVYGMPPVNQSPSPSRPAPRTSPR